MTSSCMSHIVVMIVPNISQNWWPSTGRSQAICSHSHYNDVIMSAMASPITSLMIVYSTVYSGTDQRKHQSSTSLAFVRGIHQWPVNSWHKGPVTRKMFPFDDIIMVITNFGCSIHMAPSLEDSFCNSDLIWNLQKTSDVGNFTFGK